MEGRYNIRSPAVKRLMKEAQELSEPTDQYFAQPLEDNLFEWHFTVRGPLDSDFQNGIYHGRIILPMDYPMKPPSIIWLTPNGRFETNKKICLSISGHHPESWQPSWSIRTALLAIIGFMPTHPGGAIGSLDYKPEERKVLAKKSRSWKCPVCDDVSEILLEVTPESQGANTNKEAQELAAQISFQGEKPKGKTDVDPSKVEKKDEPLPENDENAAASTVPETSPEALLSIDVSKTTTDVQTSSSTLVTSGAAGIGITSSSSEPTPIDQTTAPSVFSAPPCSTSGPSPWCANTPFLPQNFYSGQNTLGASAAMPPSFPYPPSFYSSVSSFYPPGCALPPGVGMFPCPFPPPPPYALASNAPCVISVNNSSALGSSPRPIAQTSSVNYSCSPMTYPSVSVGPQTQQPEASGEKPVANLGPTEQTENPMERQDHSQVLDELLSKVKRVGSEGNCLEAKVSKEKQESENINDKVSVELIENQAESDGPPCLKKSKSGGDVSTSEVVPSDTENSEADVPPLEVSESDPKSVLEKSTCNSTSELEKWKLKRQPKGLRHRQSATASINTENNEEINPSPDPSGQRIEAESGDSGPRSRLQSGYQGSRVVQANRDTTGRMQEAGHRQNSSDFTFFVMVVLFISTVGIFLNRLLRLYWAEDFSSKPA